MFKTAGDAKGVTTLQLARGSISSPSRPTSSLGTTLDRAGFLGSPVPRGTDSGMQILNSIGILELLQQDDRPTFILDVSDAENYTPSGPLQILFANSSLRAHDAILGMVTGKISLESSDKVVTNNFPDFKQWALSFVKNQQQSLDVALPSFLYGGLTWTCRTLRKRLRVFSVSLGSISSTRKELDDSQVLDERIRGPRTNSVFRSSLIGSPEPLDYFGHSQSLMKDTSKTASDSETDSLPPYSEDIKRPMMYYQDPEGSSFDWTRLALTAALPQHIQFARSVDWSCTILGPIESWGYDLRAISNLVMGSPNPAAVYWGDEHIAIYNEAYVTLAGQKHPDLMGQSYKAAWGEIWNEVKDVFSDAMGGKATMKDDDCLFIRRNSFLEETYFSWSFIPLVGEDGSVVGIYNPAFEETRRKIGERRKFDAPFVLLYTVSEDVDSDVGSINSGNPAQAPHCTLAHTLGVPQDHKIAISPLDLKKSNEGFAPYLREALKTDRPVLLTMQAGSLSSELVEGLESRGFGDTCTSAVIIPIHSTGESLSGFLILGINPRRPYDDDYSLFIQLLSRQITTSLTSVVLFEEEIRRAEKAARLAALDRQELSKQLDLRTRQAAESETRFTRLFEFAPVISRHPRATNSAKSWIESISDDDRDAVRDIWKRLIEDKTAVTAEFRFKTPQDRNGTRGSTWVLMSAYPEKEESGDLKSVFGSITNISEQKWAEEFQKRRTEEAIELKRQQENFIDMTSHEMRNPLSAILQCADEISTGLAEFRLDDDESVISEKRSSIIESSIDAAHTISLCAQHQKRIVDDILTLSKLDASLLMVFPIPVQPVGVVQRALKMFETELETNDISLEFRIEKQYIDLGIEWVKLDPSRLLQVLINLMTNAIKFTHSQSKRTITVSIGASLERPRDTDAGVSFFPSRSNRTPLTTDEPDWGNGEKLYLTFMVQDTGRGLDENEKTLLFQRFSQASPRTHVQYGGSGLGLFISRQLSELQGGEIGVASERGVGSRFAFYVKARRADQASVETPIAAQAISLRRNSSINSMTVENKKSTAGKAVHRSNIPGQSSRRSPALTSIASTASSPDYDTLKVLIVEDNLVNQRVLQKQLRNIGFSTAVANHGGEALQFLKTSRFWNGREGDGDELAIILMDLEMPTMDGLTCAREIRGLEAVGTIVGHVPIIAVTANARLEQIESAKAAGMDDVVSKPFRIPELIPKIEELISKSLTTPIPKVEAVIS
ncbi:hypothetical protein B7494_g919 [Chlorociboria aeruginascens]|nr:hypothetical protein B7494_g919 [Chlorociboria aeruginascens]